MEKSLSDYVKEPSTSPIVEDILDILCPDWREQEGAADTVIIIIDGS